MTAAPAPVDHFESVAWLLKELAPARIELHEHQYSRRAFGSFVVVLTSGRKEVRLTWDGRDAVLSVDFRQSRSETWTHDANISVSNGEGLYAEIASQATEMLAV
jgi:hypothetical protein